MSTQVHIGKGAQRILDMAVAEFSEDQHPRDDHGKFAPVGAGENGGLHEKVTGHAVYKKYDDGFGYKYHPQRTMEGDKTL